MKTQIISKILLPLGLVLVLGSAVTPVRGGTQPSSPSVIGPPDRQFPVITINSTDNVTRGKIGTFVLSENSEILLATTFVNFSVSGTAIPGVDYTPLVPPASIGQSGFGMLLVKTLPDPRASVVPQAHSVVITLNPAWDMPSANLTQLKRYSWILSVRSWASAFAQYMISTIAGISIARTRRRIRPEIIAITKQWRTLQCTSA